MVLMCQSLGSLIFTVTTLKPPACLVQSLPTYRWFHLPFPMAVKSNMACWKIHDLYIYIHIHLYNIYIMYIYIYSWISQLQTSISGISQPRLNPTTCRLQFRFQLRVSPGDLCTDDLAIPGVQKRQGRTSAISWRKKRAPWGKIT